MLKTHDPTHLLVLLVGGSMLLLYGVKLVTDAMERALGARLQLTMMALARRPLAAFGSGIVATLLTQSSTATASVMIGLVSAQLVPLSAAVVMLLGAAVGSTLVVQLLAFHITDYALEFLGLAAALALLSRRTKLQDVGRGVFSFGLVLVGLAMIGESSTPIADNAITNAIMQSLAQSPIVLLLLGILLAAVFVSSIAAISIVIVLTAGGALPLTGALAVILGANIGTTLTPLLSALSQSNVAGRRLGIIYTGTRLIGVAIALPLLHPIATLLTHFIPQPAAQLSLAHLGFNLILAIVFAPLANKLADWSIQLLPELGGSKKHGPRYLDPNALTLPAVALGQAMREVLRMADLATEMLQLSIQAFDESTENLPKRIGKLDDQLDDLETAIKNYLIQLNDETLTDEQAQRELSLLHISTELEAIGDIIDRQLMRLARRKRRKQIAFAQPEWSDVVAYHREVVGLLQQVLAGLATQDVAIANEVLSHRQHLNEIKRDIHLRHLQNLTSGTPISLDASAIHLETVNAIGRILSHTCSIARAVQGNL
ncbi:MULTISPECIES: Na/Pi cotransporter family protein [unclassified Leptolyngbya]|uniref:Na/Pi cotransporter family protein n=1 Tax=unclassified Leptolyngbya TaxID=2650499 RepID=UPI001688EF88|nr:MULTISPECIES: Na/Pi cotransporter family protein [unclassified Leptolyngbya]MBD1909871.1 Na/Pi cotransporter family protein [Leptolyngbya sp. FACHB-8]MBD2156967.1 Na/Pi cotransporter family protein [Leptolyngbya sp. FACHB-16]